MFLPLIVDDKVYIFDSEALDQYSQLSSDLQCPNLIREFNVSV